MNKNFKVGLIGIIIGSLLTIFISFMYGEAKANYECAKYIDEYSVKITEFNEEYESKIHAEMIFNEEDQMMIEVYLEGDLFVTNYPENFDFLIELLAE